MKYLISLCLCASVFDLHALPRHWDVDLSAQPPQVFTLQRPRGETYELEAVLKDHGKPFEPAINSAFIYWQTNGMENLYWSAPASVSNNVLRATWFPSMDPGATTVRGYIGDPGHIYAAAFQFRFIASPGATPNELPLPQKVIDFAKVTVLNPPWSGGGGSGVDTNATIDIIHATVDGAARPLPKYLHALDFDDSYPDAAAAYYRSRGDGKVDGGCSSVRDGGFLYRNFDYPFDERAEFVVKMSAGKGRFASVGIAQVGTNLTEQIVTSGKPSRCYKWLPGATVDGINEHGVACTINVVGGDPQTSGWHTEPTATPIHPLAAVRWILDNATNAQSAAEYIAANIRFPAGWTQNFHYMIVDATSTWFAEDGTAYDWETTESAVMTNYGLANPHEHGDSGIERENILLGFGANITNAWYTNAYRRETNPPWVSDLADVLAYINEIFDAWASHPKEYFRNKTNGGIPWWQSTHTSVYDLTNRGLRVAVQEVDDWYVFQVPSAGGTDETKVRAIASEVVAPVASSVSGLQSSKQNVALGYTSRHGSSTVEEELFAIDTDASEALSGLEDKVTLQPMGQLTTPEDGDIDVSGVVMGRVDVMTEGAPGRYHSLREKADLSMISATDPTFSNEVAAVARTVTPQPSPTLRVYDEVLQCWWIGRMVNGVISWEVE